MSDANVWSDTWDTGEDWSGGGALSKRLPRGDVLGATSYELGPGNFAVYHFHHGAEELMIHSQYDTNATSYWHCAAPQYSGELSADAIPIRA